MSVSLGQLLTTDFFLFALAAGLALAAIAGPLGAFIVWRRMSYFGDTLAHSALLGIAVGILIDINLQLSIMVVCLFVALSLVYMNRKDTVTTDTLLGILAHIPGHLGVNETGRNGVHSYPARRELSGHGFRESYDACLGRRVHGI